MKWLFLVCWLLGSYSITRAQNEKEKVWELIVRFDQWIVAKDSNALPSLLTSDFAGITSSGELMNKSAFIRRNCQPGQGLMSVAGQDINAAIIRVFGTTAYVSRALRVEIKIQDGSRSELEIRRMECCVKENGKWLIAISQGTRINPGGGSD